MIVLCPADSHNRTSEKDKRYAKMAHHKQNLMVEDMSVHWGALCQEHSLTSFGLLVVDADQLLAHEAVEVACRED